MSDSDEKDKLEASLKSSAFWEVRKKKEALEAGTRILTNLLESTGQDFTGDVPAALVSLLSNALHSKAGAAQLAALPSSSTCSQALVASSSKAVSNPGVVRKLFTNPGGADVPSDKTLAPSMKPNKLRLLLKPSSKKEASQVSSQAAPPALPVSATLASQLETLDPTAPLGVQEQQLVPLDSTANTATPGLSSSGSKRGRRKAKSSGSKEKSGKLEIEQALHEVGLDRISNSQDLIVNSVNEVEDDSFRQFCGLLEQARVNSDSTTALPDDSQLNIDSDEGLNFSFSGMDDIQMEGADLEDVSLEN